MIRKCTFLLLILTSLSFANYLDTIRLAIFVNNQKTGYMLITRQELNDTVITVSKSVMKMQRGNAANTIKTVEITTIFEDRNGKPLSFTHLSTSNNMKRSFIGIFSDSGYINVTESSSSGRKQYN